MVSRFTLMALSNLHAIPLEKIVKLVDDYRCIQCRKEIPPGKAGRKCKDCRQKLIEK